MAGGRASSSGRRGGGVGVVRVLPSCPAASTPHTKRRCLGTLPADLTTLSLSRCVTERNNGFKLQSGDFERSIFVKPHKDLLREKDWPEGWALAVECSTVSGVGDALSLFDGGMLDDSIRDAAYVALALVKTRQHTLRRWLGVSDPQQGQDLRAPNIDVNLQINPSLYPRSGGSIGAAMLVSFMALATGLPTRKDVGVTGALNLMGEVEPVEQADAKARAAAKAGATGLVLPHGCPLSSVDYEPPPLEKEVGGVRRKRKRVPDPKQQKDDGTRTHMQGVALYRVRDMWELALAALAPTAESKQPFAAHDLPKPTGLDEGCYSGQASCGTYLVSGGKVLSVYVQKIEVVGYPSKNAPYVTGMVGVRTVGSCNSAIGWLSKNSSQLAGALRWPSMDGLSFHFHLGPFGVESDEWHLGPTIYMALVSAATGWTADPKVSIVAEVTMHGGVLELTCKPSRLDLVLMGSIAGVKVWVVPEGSKADFEKAWREQYGEEKKDVTFVGIKSIWDALLLVFAKEHGDWRAAQREQQEQKGQPTRQVQSDA